MCVCVRGCVRAWVRVCLCVCQAPDDMWYTTQMTGCSYILLQSRNIFGGLTSSSNVALHAMSIWVLGCSYLDFLQPNDVFDTGVRPNATLHLST